MSEETFEESRVIIVGSVNGGQRYMLLVGLDVTNNELSICFTVHSFHFEIECIIAKNCNSCLSACTATKKGFVPSFCPLHSGRALAATTFL